MNESPLPIFILQFGVELPDDKGKTFANECRIRADHSPNQVGRL